MAPYDDIFAVQFSKFGSRFIFTKQNTRGFCFQGMVIATARGGWELKNVERKVDLTKIELKSRPSRMGFAGCCVAKIEGSKGNPLENDPESVFSFFGWRSQGLNHLR